MMCVSLGEWSYIQVVKPVDRLEIVTIYDGTCS